MLKLGVKYYPDSYYLNLNLGTVLVSFKKLPEAIQAYLKALEANPDSIKALNNIAMAYYLLGNIRLATKYWEKSLNLNPDQPELKKQILYINRELKKLRDQNKTK